MKHNIFIGIFAVLAMAWMVSASVETVLEVENVAAAGCSVSVSQTANSQDTVTGPTNKTLHFVVLVANSGSKTASSVTFDITTVSNSQIPRTSGITVVSKQTLPDTRNVYKLRIALNLTPGKSVTATYDLTVGLTVRRASDIDNIVPTCL